MQIFQKKIIQLPTTNFQMILNTKNENYMKVWESQLCPKASGERSKSWWADSTPPPFLGLK